MSDLADEDKFKTDFLEVYTLKDLDLFCSADLNIIDGRQGRRISNSILFFRNIIVREWTPIKPEVEADDGKNLEHEENNKNEIDEKNFHSDKIEKKSDSKSKNKLLPVNNSNNKYIPFPSSNNNLILKNKIIKLIDSRSNLKNFGIELEIQILMGGESSLYIFSRAEEFNSDMAICFIEKELDSNRKFLNFAVMEITDDVNLIKTLKKQEIPKTDNYTDNLDVCEVNLTFIDNCDNRCSLLVSNRKENDFIFYADVFTSINELSNIMIGASGDLVSLRSMNIKQVRKNQIKSIYRNSTDKITQTCCCSII